MEEGPLPLTVDVLDRGRVASCLFWCVYVCVGGEGFSCDSMQAWRKETTQQESVFSSYHVGPGDRSHEPSCCLPFFISAF